MRFYWLCLIIQCSCIASTLPTLEQTLLQAVDAGNIFVVKSLLHEEIHIQRANACKLQAETLYIALYNAATAGNLPLTQLLLTAYLALQGNIHAGLFVIMQQSITHNHPLLIQFVIQYYQRISFEQPQSCFLLVLAHALRLSARLGNLSLLQLILPEYLQYLSSTQQEITAHCIEALEESIHKNHVPCMHYILSTYAAACVQSAGKLFAAALQTAVRSRNLGILQQLIARNSEFADAEILLILPTLVVQATQDNNSAGIHFLMDFYISKTPQKPQLLHAIEEALHTAVRCSNKELTNYWIQQFYSIEEHQPTIMRILLAVQQEALTQESGEMAEYITTYIPTNSSL